jgi:hypothetical protein
LFHLDPADNLLRTRFIVDQRLDKLPDLAAYPGVCLVVTLPQRQMIGLSRPIPLQAPISAQLPANGRDIPLQQIGNLCLAIFGIFRM